MANLEFSDVVKRIVEQYVKEYVYTAIPARVIGVDNFNSEQVIDIQPQIVDTFKDDKNVELPPILDVPVQYPGGGGGLLSFPIEVGDTVLAVISQKSIDEWVNSDATQNSYTPRDKRTYSINDAIAIPGLYTKRTNLNPNATDVELKFADSSIKISPNGKITITSSNDVEVNTTGNLIGDIDGNATIDVGGNVSVTSGGTATVTASTINLQGNVNITGNLTVSGSTSLSSTVTSNGVDISDTHIHPATPPASPTDFSGPPQ